MKGDVKHKVIINVTRPVSIRILAIESQKRTIRSKFLSLLLGEKVSLIVITSGESVETVEIKETEREIKEIERNRETFFIGRFGELC